LKSGYITGDAHAVNLLLMIMILLLSLDRKGSGVRSGSGSGAEGMMHCHDWFFVE
jgi:hypothetical protein